MAMELFYILTISVSMSEDVILYYSLQYVTNEGNWVKDTEDLFIRFHITPRELIIIRKLKGLVLKIPEFIYLVIHI